MGYITTFTGQLKFKNELTTSALAKLKTFLGEDVRDHQEWDAEGSYIDLRITDDFSGIEWDDETEKNDGMVSHVNLIINEMKKDFPNFELEGQLLAQGEDPKDQWVLIAEKGLAYEKKLEIACKFVTCPNCEHEFQILTQED